MSIGRFYMKLLFIPALVLLSICTGAAQTNTFPASGNVGIGTTAPIRKLHLIYSSSVANANYDTYAQILFEAPDSRLQLVASNAGTGGAGIVLTNASATSNSHWHINHVGSAIGDGLLFRNSTTSANGDTYVATGTNVLYLEESGNVGIGTTNPTQKLSVNGTVRAKEVIVDTGWSDYVFSPEYRLAPLSEVERHIKAEQHLPGIPSAAEVAEHGISVGEMQAKLLAKIEELTLHVIEQEKRTQAQAAGMAALLAENAELRARVDVLSQRR